MIVPIVYSVTAAPATKARPGSTLTSAVRPADRAGVEHSGSPLARRRRRLTGDVGDAEPAAEDELGEGEAGGELGHHRGRLGEAVGDEDVRPDVAVEADEVHRRRPLRPQRGALGVAVGEVEAELGVVLPGGDVRVRVGVDSRRDTQQDVRSGQALAVEGVEAIELVEAVDDDAPHAGGDRQPQLVAALVVAVHDARRGRHSCSEDDVQLATTGDVEQQTLVVHDPGDRPAEERLGGVDDPTRTEGLDGFTTAVADVFDVVDEQRSPEPSGHLEERAATDAHRAIRLDRRRVGQQPGLDRRHAQANLERGGAGTTRRIAAPRNPFVSSGIDAGSSLVPETSRRKEGTNMLKIEATKFALGDLRAVPFACTAWNALGAGRNRGCSTVAA